MSSHLIRALSAVDWDFARNICFSATGNYTGSMLVPYFGTETNPEIGELRKSEDFFDLGLKLRYTIKLNGANLQSFGGIKNIFNSYQNDFDTGADRDPAYMYGPVSPRTIYFGVKIGNIMPRTVISRQNKENRHSARQHRRRHRGNK